MVLLGTCLLLDVCEPYKEISGLDAKYLEFVLELMCVPDNGKSELSDITWMCLNHTTGYKN